MFPTDFGQYFSPALRDAERGKHKPYYQYLDLKRVKSLQNIRRPYGISQKFQTSAVEVVSAQQKTLW